MKDTNKNEAKERVEKFLVAVYGTLRRKGSRENILNRDKQTGEYNTEATKKAKVEYKGTFASEPMFSLYKCGSYPGLDKAGRTSVIFEVYEYEADNGDALLDLLDGIEGTSMGLFKREHMLTPWGKAWVYYKCKIQEGTQKIYSGDFIDYIKSEYLISDAKE